jgi:hypothetical protein
MVKKLDMEVGNKKIKADFLLCLQVCIKVLHFIKQNSACKLKKV